MAICKYGPLVSEVRGSIGGTTFTANHFGSVVRQRRHPVHAPTARRDTYKALLAMATARWTDSLTQNQRDAWDALGAATDFTNSLNQVYHPTGINLYCRTNILLRHPTVLTAWCDTAPGNAIGAHYPLTYTSASSGEIEAEMEDEPAVRHDVLMWHGLPQRPSVKYYTGPWVSFEAWDSEVLHLAATEIFHAPAHLRDFRYFTRDRAIYDTGELSAPYIQSIIVTD